MLPRDNFNFWFVYRRAQIIDESTQEEEKYYAKIFVMVSHVVVNYPREGKTLLTIFIVILTCVF